MTFADISEDQLEAFVNENDIVFVDFTATWCAPCKIMGKIFHELDGEIDIAVAKIDIDQNPGISNALQVTAVPTVMIFFNGKRLVFESDRGRQDRFMGVQPKEMLVEIVNHLRNDPNATEDIE
ncbi:MAG: thioredoxin family protein [Promethearchaeota archaeon]